MSWRTTKITVAYAPHLPEFVEINQLLIKNSECFQLDPSLAEHYPGSGSSGSNASVRIQFEYDLKRGTINDLSLSPFNVQDAKNAIATVDLVNEGYLIMRGLPYVGLDALKGIATRSTYHLCRLSPGIKVYKSKGCEYMELDIVKIHRE
ncbi:MAG: hypothetical protein ACI9Y1_003484 [Lentisphaeria bacterium]